MDDNKRIWTGLIIWGAGFSALMLAIVAAIFLLLTNEPTATTVQISPPLPTQTATASPIPAPFEIYVVGAIQTPEARISLPRGSRVEDALALVGVLENADLAQVNLAQLLQDGDMIFVPQLVDEFTGETVGQDILTPTPNAPRLVNLNTATRDELDTLPGIGPTIAGRIITYREENGLFLSVDEIVNVSGIGVGTLEDIRPYVTVE